MQQTSVSWWLTVTLLWQINSVSQRALQIWFISSKVPSKVPSHGTTCCMQHVAQHVAQQNVELNNSTQLYRMWRFTTYRRVAMVSTPNQWIPPLNALPMFHIRHQRRSSSAFSCSRSTESAFNPGNDCFVIMPDWQRVTESLNHIAGGWHHILVVGIDTSLMDGTESLINGRNRFTDGCDFLLYHEVYNTGEAG